MANDSFIVENVLALTMDSDLGEIRGDIVVKDGKIAAVGGDSGEADGERIDGTAMVAIPGFVDTHRHTWQAPLRFTSVGWTLLEYIEGLQQALAPLFSPEDVYAANLLGALTALDAGITTLRDDSHVQNSVAHGEAAIQALRDSGIRASFGHGWPSSVEYMTDSGLPHPESLETVRNTVLTDDAALVSMHAHLRGPSLSTIETSVEDLQRARDLGLRSSIHVGAELFPGADEIRQLHDRGLLGSDLTFVHCCTTTDEEIEMMASAGCSASVTPLIEGSMPGLGWPATARLAAAGVTTSFGVDVEVAAAGDMFNVMRAALVADRLRGAEDRDAATSRTPNQLLEHATIGGATACGFEQRVGSLTPGKDADLVLIDASGINTWSPVPGPSAVLAAAGPRDIDSVFVAGVPRKRHGELVGVDLGEVYDRATASLERLRRESGVAS